MGDSTICAATRGTFEGPSTPFPKACPNVYRMPRPRVPLGRIQKGNSKTEVTGLRFVSPDPENHGSKVLTAPEG